MTEEYLKVGDNVLYREWGNKCKAEIVGIVADNIIEIYTIKILQNLESDCSKYIMKIGEFLDVVKRKKDKYDFLPKI